MQIPRCMSTQHPDNVQPPFFAKYTELGGDDEIQEAYYTFSHLGCDEQMWDCEGKEVDTYVVKKLLTKYDTFFKDKRLGKDVNLTLRVPNPAVEKAEAKILLETLESIPRSFDAAKLFYGDDISPIFEVILPMTGSSQCLDRIFRYYSDFVIDRQNKPFKKNDITIAEWIGAFKPEKINVIPLFEDKDHILHAHTITKEYMQDKNVDYQRVFLARSDPAMNYGLIAAVLFNKIALQRLNKLSKEMGVPIYPIIGVGSAPFRGNLRPQTIERVTEEYPSVYTFTIQSAFKYDNPPEEVKEAVKKLRQRIPTMPHDVDEKRVLEIIDKYTVEYRRQIKELAPLINRVARFVPGRRKRKLHIGLFGYARSLDGITLPRAITFTSSLYSVGVPPEVLGLNALSKDDIKFVKEVFINFDLDLQDALRFLNVDSPYMPSELKQKINGLSLNFETNRENKEITDYIISTLQESRNQDLTEYVLRAANLRKFLG